MEELLCFESNCLQCLQSKMTEELKKEFNNEFVFNEGFCTCCGKRLPVFDLHGVKKILIKNNKNEQFKNNTR